MLSELIEILQEYMKNGGDVPVYMRIEELDNENVYKLTSTDLCSAPNEKLLILNSRL